MGILGTYIGDENGIEKVSSVGRCITCYQVVWNLVSYIAFTASRVVYSSSINEKKYSTPSVCVLVN